MHPQFFLRSLYIWFGWVHGNPTSFSESSLGELQEFIAVGGDLSMQYPIQWYIYLNMSNYIYKTLHFLDI